MVFTRKTKANIRFDVYRITDNTKQWSFNKNLDVDEIDYPNREAAYRFGTLEEWANKIAKHWAIKTAALEVGEDLPKSDVDKVTGVSFEARHIRAFGYEFTETGCELDKGDIANLEVMLREIRDNIDITDYVDEQIRNIDKILETNNCEREDIRELISKYKVQNVIR